MSFALKGHDFSRAENAPKMHRALVLAGMLQKDDTRRLADLIRDSQE
jgi:hypothetical protein